MLGALQGLIIPADVEACPVGIAPLVVLCIFPRQGETADILWSDTKRQLGSVDAFKTPYFVRVKGADAKDKVTEAFGDVQFIDSDLDETAFITGVMTGSDFKAASAGLEVVSRIRVSA